MNPTASKPETDWAQEEARTILEHVNSAAVELAFVRHGLTSDEFDEDDSREEEIERIKQDTLNCLTGDDFGCLSEEELDETNCEGIWLAARLHTAEERGYARGYLDAANEIAEPYPPDIPMFAPLTNEEIETAVAAMGGDISGRLHAHWARHWADVLRKRIEEKQDG